MKTSDTQLALGDLALDETPKPRNLTFNPKEFVVRALAGAVPWKSARPKVADKPKASPAVNLAQAKAGRKTLRFGKVIAVCADLERQMAKA